MHMNAHQSWQSVMGGGGSDAKGNGLCKEGDEKKGRPGATASVCYCILPHALQHLSAPLRPSSSLLVFHTQHEFQCGQCSSLNG